MKRILPSRLNNSDNTVNAKREFHERLISKIDYKPALIAFRLLICVFKPIVKYRTRLNCAKYSTVDSEYQI